LAGDVALDALWYAYRLGQTGQELYMVGFSGCEENKNFCIVLDVKELYKMSPYEAFEIYVAVKTHLIIHLLISINLMVKQINYQFI